MEGLANKWKAMLQSQSAEDIKLSRMTASKNEEPKSKIKESLGLFAQQAPRDKEGKSKDKNKNSRTKSNERRGSASKNTDSCVFQASTPVKLVNKRQEKLIERYTDSIIELFQQGGLGGKSRGKVRALLEDLIVNAGVESNGTSSLRVSVGDRAYQDLENRYLQSEKQRQYLKGKMQMSSKRSEGLERELERYSKMQKLIDSSINRENQLRQEINKVKTQKDLLSAAMQEQNQTFEREVEGIRELIEALKTNMRVN